MAEGTVIGEGHSRDRAREFLALLSTLDRSTPSELDLHLILDSSATHKTAKVKRWVLRHPRFHFLEAPKLYVATYNEDPRPFQWQATADRFLVKVRWNRLNVELAGAPH